MNKFIEKSLCTLATGLRIKSTAKAPTSLSTGANIPVIGSITTCRAKEFKLGLMGADMKVSLSLIIGKAMAYILGLVVASMKANGSIIRSTERACIPITNLALNQGGEFGLMVNEVAGIYILHAQKNEVFFFF